MDKLVALHEILQLDPANSFARYGLAMEHIARGDREAALAEFSTLIANSPDYVPAYQISAQTLVTLGRIDAAIARLDQGIDVARRTADGHALAEMSSMREEIASR